MIRGSMKHLFLVSLGLCAVIADARATLRDQFAWSQPLAVPAGAPIVQIDLPVSVYRDSVDPALGDVRVLNGAGEVVPFAFRRPAQAVRGIQTTVSVPFFPLRGAAAVSGAALQFRIDAGRTFIEVEGAQPEAATAPVSGYLVNVGDLDRAIDALTFNWPEDSADFSLNLAISVSDDLVQWRLLVPRAPVVRLRHAGQLFEQRSVTLPATRTRYLRVGAAESGELPEFTMTAATLVSGSVPVARLQTDAAGVADAQEAGVYTFDLGAQLPVDRVLLLLPDVNTVAQAEFYSRRSASEQWRFIIAASPYRIQAANAELVSDPLAVPEGPQRFWRVKVDQRGGGIGGGTPQLRAGWLPDQIVFLTRGSGPFELVFGSAASGTSHNLGGAAVPLAALLPQGDASFENAAADGIPQAAVGERRVAGGPERLLPPPPAGSWRIWVLWAALLAGVAALGTVAWKLARQMRTS